MKLKDLHSTKIVIEVLGERPNLKTEDELSVVLKKRLTKKEMFAMNAKVTNADMQDTLEKLCIDEDRYNEILATVYKKLKNESVHKDFYAKII